MIYDRNGRIPSGTCYRLLNRAEKFYDDKSVGEYGRQSPSGNVLSNFRPDVTRILTHVGRHGTISQRDHDLLEHMMDFYFKIVQEKVNRFVVIAYNK